MTRAPVPQAALAGVLLAAGCLQDAQRPDHTAVFTGNQSTDFRAHVILYSANIVGFEMVAWVG